MAPVLVARARDARHAQRLYELGATDAVPETVEASLQLSEALLVEIGVPMGLVIASIHERRDEYRKVLNRPESLGGRSRAFRRDADAAHGDIEAVGCMVCRQALPADYVPEQGLSRGQHRGGGLGPIRGPPGVLYSSWRHCNFS